MTSLPAVAGYSAELLVQGFPGKSIENGGLGWSAVVLLRGHGRVILVDTGSFSIRRVLQNRLGERGITRHEVTDVLLTHSHYDHAMNWPLFPNARVWISRAELAWALEDPIETSLVAELYIRELSRSPQLQVMDAGDEVLTGIGSLEMPGHTPHHLVFVLEDKETRLILAGDAVKNRAELMSSRGDLTLDAGKSAGSIAAIRSLWEEVPGAVLVAGHDLPMRNDDGTVQYLGERRAGVTAWFDPDLAKTTTISLRGSEG